MNIAGFQPLSLIDYPGKTCAIVFTQGCVFRCPFCHNPELIPLEAALNAARVEEESVLAQLTKHKGMIEGVVITGGEPTLQIDLELFISKLKGLGFLVKLDTNGIHPRIVESLLEKKLVDFFAMDLKHRWERYEEVVRTKSAAVVENCQKTFSLIQSSGVPHEFRTTVYAGFHTEEDLMIMASYLKEGESYALQQIRYEKMLDSTLAKQAPLPLFEITERMHIRFPSLKIEVRE